FIGEARLTPGFTVGFVPQEPHLDETTDVRGNIEQAVAHIRALLHKQEELGNKMAEASPEEFDKLSDEMDRVNAKIDAVNAWELEWARVARRGGVAKNKARLSAYEKLASQQYEEREDELVLQIPPGPPLGGTVVRAEALAKAYGELVLFEDVNFDLPRGGIVG